MSFVLVVALGPLTAPAGVPLALVAQRQCERTGERGTGLAKATMFIGIAYLVLAVAVVLLGLLTNG
ncbi:DUF4190 domain-containing protein [Mycolicibacterium diernhoferi]|uniref:DUF4190 domain-containing protein n=1 Tax=Mycolicibacterium diernhoferi TaxID=1801 RepID=A0A1Q4H9K0_9MYCO|nr:DUF4190 domain-containing protein [Mycolicibacterium diernhoferi]OJZ64183.1 hypothetical protein BRW64_18975 [Mycolicibacterium diernhoferi]OPE56090.1 hypothetical protein BV510_01555 [Mycolicibacterium diernhoferi]PEG55212.1 DUF4190 domain-containing protein [Mycolicibacterium diernhoferi]QYL21767.1 DUF4190 domain-containing protein [Mycolicibacterium diernhoferi]